MFENYDYYYYMHAVVDCGPLPHPAHGTVQYVRSIYGSEATYNCNDTYVLLGENQRTCQVNGEWSELEPLCECTYVCMYTNSPKFSYSTYIVLTELQQTLILPMSVPDNIITCDKWPAIVLL